MSGGRATILLKKGDKAGSQAGDISSVDNLGHPLIDKFVIECKSYNSLELHKLLTGGKTGIIQFWRKLNKEAKAHQKLPMLIAKQNNMKPIMILNMTGMTLLLHHIPALAILPRHRMFLFNFTDFIRDADPEVLL